MVLHPAGDVATQQRDLLVESTLLMLLIIIPVIAATVLFAWRYRQSNTSAHYEPEWDHSTQLELLIWGAPLLIVICLGAMTWMGTHLLDPYRPLDREAAAHAEGPPLQVEVVALDWKWLFIYPQYGVATVNELAAPMGRPINFHITSSSVMNSFAIPALAGQIYAMPGMDTELHAVMGKPGVFQGFSANYSGAGFSKMHFLFRSLNNADFNRWVAGLKAQGQTLSGQAYLALEKPSEGDTPHGYAAVETGLYKRILDMCVEPGKMCMSQMTDIDAKGGLGLAGVNNVLPLEYDKLARRGGAPEAQRAYVAALCHLPAAPAPTLAKSTPVPVNTAHVIGAGLSQPPLRLGQADSAGLSPTSGPTPVKR